MSYSKKEWYCAYADCIGEEKYEDRIVVFFNLNYD